MSQLHFCKNGVSVTQQVINYQTTRDEDDYRPIQDYYIAYMDWWHKQVEEYIDRLTFDSDFIFKLYTAVIEFNQDKADELAKKNRWNPDGNFNRWFYKVLTNWKSNIRTAGSRHKKRPPVQCPCCGRLVSKITEEHLQHYISISDLPVVFEWEGKIYQTTTIPAKEAWCWGEYTKQKLNQINNKAGKAFARDKHKVDWPWHDDKGHRMVVCPFTKVLISKINEKHIRELPTQFSRYTDPVSWNDFVRDHPMVLIQAEIYSLDYDQGDDELYLRDTVAREYQEGDMDAVMVEQDAVTAKYEHTFRTIDKFIQNQTDRKILKLTAIGYRVEDIAETMAIAKADVRKRVLAARQIRGFEAALKP